MKTFNSAVVFPLSCMVVVFCILRFAFDFIMDPVVISVLVLAFVLKVFWSKLNEIRKTMLEIRNKG